MIKTTKILFLIIASMLIISCKKDNKENTKTPVTFEYNLKDFNEATGYKDIAYTITEINTNKKIELKADEKGMVKASLNAGFYKIKVSGTAIYKRNNADKTIMFEGISNLKEIQGNNPLTIVVDAYLAGKLEPKIGSYKNLVLKEIFVSGNAQPNGYTYSMDSYFIIHNNSDEIVYADSLCLLEGAFQSNLSVETDPEKVNEQGFVAHEVFMIPGNGKTYPIQPGGDMILAQQARNHKEFCPNSFDLTKANFEWYEVDPYGISNTFDNPEVPNLEKIYSESETIWIPNGQGNVAWGIAKMKVSKEKFLKDNALTYTDKTYPDNPRQFTYYEFPSDWVADAVQSCPKSQIPDAFQTIDPKLDKGFTYNHIDEYDDFAAGKSMMRKIKENKDGIVIYQDTNNSANDFEPKEASLKN